jgi:hypothetical protein
VKLVGSIAHVLDTALLGLPGATAASAASVEAFGEGLHALEAGIAARQALARQEDSAAYAAARAHHLLPVTEFVLPRHAPQPLPERLPVGMPQDLLVSAGGILERVAEDALVRSGNLQLGSQPPDFARAGAQDPRFLAQTQVGASRVGATVARFAQTVGGFGPAFHRTQAPGLVDGAWGADQPPRAAAPLAPHPLCYAGEAWPAKVARVAHVLLGSACE